MHIQETFRALSDPTRRAIITLLQGGPLHAQQIVDHFDITNATVSHHLSILKKAGLNTLLGMGTVFTVLIFISFIISLFNYIPAIQAKFGKKEAASPAAAPAMASEPEEELSDDLELVAVISAAIAAYEGTSSDGFVVRSIKRKTTNKWN